MLLGKRKHRWVSEVLLIVLLFISELSTCAHGPMEIPQAVPLGIVNFVYIYIKLFYNVKEAP